MRDLASLCLDLWLLGEDDALHPLPGGGAYQNAVARALRRPGMRSIQKAGLHTLWSFRAASGVEHELDAAARRGSAAFLIEAKATTNLAKADLAVFELKITDHYFARWRTVASQAWWPILSSAGPANDATGAWPLTAPSRSASPVHCRSRSFTTTPPTRPPAAVSRGTLCRELARLAPRALQTMQERYRPDLHAACLYLEPRPYTATELDDLLFCQAELTGEVLARYERLDLLACRPGAAGPAPLSAPRLATIDGFLRESTAESLPQYGCFRLRKAGNC